MPASLLLKSKSLKDTAKIMEDLLRQIMKLDRAKRMELAQQIILTIQAEEALESKGNMYYDALEKCKENYKDGRLVSLDWYVKEDGKMDDGFLF